jgi:site-specific DNA-cytosine methylase
MVGYNVEYALHNAADYGVPQFRRRIFFYGMRKDINKPILFPLPTHFGKEGDKDSQLHRCVQCQKLYASYTFNKNREIVCLFCDHHNKNEEVSHDEQPIEANWIVIPQKVMVPAPIETMMMVGFFEKRTSIKGTTRFLYCWKHDGSVEWFKSSEVRKVVDNDKECDAAEAFIMNRMVIQPIKNVLLGCDADELNDEGGENDEDGII